MLCNLCMLIFPAVNPTDSTFLLISLVSWLDKIQQDPGVYRTSVVCKDSQPLSDGVAASQTLCMYNSSGYSFPRNDAVCVTRFGDIWGVFLWYLYRCTPENTWWFEGYKAPAILDSLHFYEHCHPVR